MLLRDLQVALRRLAREPKHSAIVIVMLAIGLGATTATFNVLNRVVLRPLPYPHSEALVSLVSSNRERGIQNGNVSIGDFVAWRERARSFEALAATGYAELVLAGEGEPERITTAAVSPNFLRVLGVRPLLGRDFLPTEETPGRDQVVLLSHDLWRRRFSGDRGIVGQTLRLSGDPYQVIGVMPAGFSFHGRDVGFWSPMAIDMQNLVRQRRGIGVIARLRRGVSLARAEREMSQLSQQVASEFPATDAGWEAQVLSLHEKITGGSRAPLALLFGAALIVLGLAVSNVANLMVARLLSHARESMIRMATGARRIDLIRPHLLENLLLSLAGGAAGVVLARLGLRLLRALAAVDVPRLSDASLDRVSAMLAFALSGVAALALTALPALQGARPLWQRWTDELRGGTGRNGRRLTETIAVAELSLALVLLIGSGLLLRSLREVTRVDPGFEATGVVVMNLSLPLSRYPDEQRQGAFFSRLLERVRSLPQSAAAAVSSGVPLNGAALNADAPIARAERTVGGGREERAAVRLVSEAYFGALRIPLRAGRDLAERDGPRMPRVALVNEALAKRVWPAESPVGRRLRVAYKGDEICEVIGVVGDVRHRGFEREASPEVFLSYRQHPAFFASLVVRTRRDPGAAIPFLKSAVWSIDREQDMTVSTMESLVEAYLLPRKLLTDLLAVFTGIALAIALLGVFSMSSYVAEQRSREFGIRIALGARRGDVARQMLARTMALTAMGLGIGLLAAYLGSRYVASFLFGVQPLDPIAVLGALAVLVMVAMGGSYLPVRRAAGRDPMDALRNS